MEKRELSKDLVIGERRFRVHKFEAQTGSYIAYQLFSNLLPMLAKNGLPSLDSTPEQMMQNIQGAIPTLPREQFFELQKDCLCVCQEITTVATVETPMPVMLPDGRYGIADIETNIGLAMALTIHALIFNVSGFFGESGLKGLTGSFSGLSR